MSSQRTRSGETGAGIDMNELGTSLMRVRKQLRVKGMGSTVFTHSWHITCTMFLHIYAIALTPRQARQGAPAATVLYVYHR